MKKIISLLLISFLAACDSGSKDSPSDTIGNNKDTEEVTQVDISGIYQFSESEYGTEPDVQFHYREDNQKRMFIITEKGNFFFTTSGTHLAGHLEADKNEPNQKGKINKYFQDSPKGPMRVGILASDRTESSGLNSTFEFNFDQENTLSNIYITGIEDLPATARRINNQLIINRNHNGNYVGYYPITNDDFSVNEITDSMSIDEDGYISGSDTYGCIYDGYLKEQSVKTGIYKAEVDINCNDDRSFKYYGYAINYQNTDNNTYFDLFLLTENKQFYLHRHYQLN